MKLGFCGSIEQAGMIKGCGYGYIGMNLSSLAALSETDFFQTIKHLVKTGLPCLALRQVVYFVAPIMFRKLLAE